MKTLALILFLIFSAHAREFLDCKINHRQTEIKTKCEYASGYDIHAYHHFSQPIKLENLYVIGYLFGNQRMLIETDIKLEDGNGTFDMDDVFRFYKYDGILVNGPQPSEILTVIPLKKSRQI